MSERYQTIAVWVLTGLVILSWLAFAFVFVGSTVWMPISGNWSDVWNGLDLDPPWATSVVFYSWGLITGRIVWFTAPTFILLLLGSAVTVFRMKMNGGVGWWLLRGLLLALPILGVAFVIFGVHIAPRVQLAQALELDSLPQYASFPTYRETAIDSSAPLIDRQQALYSIHAMCMLEKLRISPPANSHRISSLQSVEAYLEICRNKSEPIELRLYAAARLNHAFIQENLMEYPEGATVTKASAQRLVASTMVDVVQDGGPIGYDGWGSSSFETHLPGDWAMSTFKHIKPNREVVERLADSLNDPSVNVRAGAVAALGTIGSSEEDTLVLGRLQLLSDDSNSRIRELADDAIRKISDPQ